METLESKRTSINSDFEVIEFFIEPIQNELAEEIMNSISANKIFLTRIDYLKVESLIVKKSTSIFTYSTVHDVSNEEISNNNGNSVNTFLEINPEYRYENSNIIQSGKNFIAAEDGLFILENKKPRIVPVSLDGSCDVKLSDDSMSVYVDIYPSIDNNPITTYDDIVEKVIKMGINAEIKKALLIEKLKDVESKKNKILNLLVVEGKRAINGIDGRLENCTNKKEKIENFCFDEFHRVNPVISVKKEELIAILHPPTEGENGKDIFGKILKPKPGKMCSLRLGTNTCFSEKNENYIIAKKDGFLNLTESAISVTDTFTVKGDIDFESGNIIAKGSLKVIGNVKNDFTLNLTKDIEIGGYVGDALVEAGENIIICGGFLGKGNGIVRANGDIKVKFIENQKVFSRGSLQFRNDTLNAKLFVKNKIFSESSRSSIIGGHAIAGESIEVYSLGNDTRTETVVEVGFDYLKRNSIIKNKERQIYLRTRLEEVDKAILELARMKRLNPQNKEKLELLAKEHKTIVAEIDLIKGQNLKITSEIYIPTLSRISVQGITYPGVKIGINGRFLLVENIMKAKTFVLSNNNEVIATQFHT